MSTLLSKIHPVFHNIANGIKRGSNSKMNGKHAAEYSKAVMGRKVICVRCINCSYSNIASVQNDQFRLYKKI